MLAEKQDELAAATERLEEVRAAAAAASAGREAELCAQLMAAEAQLATLGSAVAERAAAEAEALAAARDEALREAEQRVLQPLRARCAELEAEAVGLRERAAAAADPEPPPSFEAQIQRLGEQIQGLRSELDDKESLCQNMRSELADKECLFREMHSELEVKGSLVQSLQADVALRESQILVLKSQLEAAEQRCVALQHRQRQQAPTQPRGRQRDLLSFDDDFAAAEGPPTGGEGDLLDLSGLSIAGEVDDGLVGSATEPTTAAAVSAFEQELSSAVGAALGEAETLLQKLRAAEQKAAQLVVSGAGDGVALDATLAGFEQVGDAISGARTSADAGLRKPGPRAGGLRSDAVRSAELSVRRSLADVIEELALRSATLNESRCDRVLSAMLSAPSDSSQRAFPPSSNAAAPPLPVAPGGPNVLSALGQRMTEAVSTHWTGLGTTFGAPLLQQQTPGGTLPAPVGGGNPRRQATGTDGSRGAHTRHAS